MKIEDIHYDLQPIPVDEENFDIEKWRLQNPVDYFKFMYMINISANKNEVFQLLYKISRLYIPDTLYKYYSFTDDKTLNQQKLQTLEQQKIFMSDVKFLNDPFDNKAFYYKADTLIKYERLIPHGGRLIDDFSTFTKVSSLTANSVNSMPMWAHYANNHSGYCVSYDTKHNTQLSGCTFPIQYTNERIDITSVMDKQVQYMINQIEIQGAEGKKEILLDDLSLVFLSSYFCNIKHSSWSYENEFRCTTGANAKGMPYVVAKPKEIYIGLNCSESNIEKLIKIGKTLKIPVYKMFFDELSESFDLIFREI